MKFSPPLTTTTLRRLAIAAAYFSLVAACTGSVVDESAAGSPSNNNNSPKTETKPGEKPPGEGPGGIPKDKPEPPPAPFDPQPGEAYVTKIKDLLTGHAPTAEEIQKVKADPKALRGLVDEWQKTDDYRRKTLDWLASAFQQDQIQETDLADQAGVNLNGSLGPTNLGKLKESLSRSFALTMMKLIDEGKPFTEALTTHSFMMNTAMVAYMAFLDAHPVDDEKKRPRDTWFMRRFADITVTMTKVGTSASPEPQNPNGFNPDSPDFFKFNYTPPEKNDNCDATKELKSQSAIVAAYTVMWGHTHVCNGKLAPVMKDSDWDDYRMVTVRQAQDDESHSVFFEIDKLRKSNELVLSSQRVGFMTTPAFFGTWATNDANAFRVTANQTMITALALTFEAEGPGIALDDSNLDGEHAEKGTVCYGCHITLDPMRDFFRHDYGVYYSSVEFDDPTKKHVPDQASFSADDSEPITGRGVETLGKALAKHPRFALAWALKLCQSANAGLCLEDDPELVRIAKVFQESGFKFNALIGEVFSSPIVTFASRTKTGEQYDAIMSVARREVLCDRLSIRTGQTDVCNLRNQKSIRSNLNNLSLGLPTAGYARGEVAPVLPKEPNLFFATSVDGMCKALSLDLVESKANRVWTFAEKDKAVADFASVLLGLTDSDPVKSASEKILAAHIDEALAAGATDADALRSAFIVACTSPLSTSLGL